MALPRELLLPLQVNASGGISFTSDVSRILQQRVVSAVGTQVGERVMLPRYGTDLISDLFEGNDEQTFDDIASKIRTAVVTLVPEVGLLDVQVFSDPDNNGAVATIRYTESNGVEAAVSTNLPLGARA